MEEKTRKHCKTGCPLLEGWRRDHDKSKDFDCPSKLTLFLAAFSMSVNFPTSKKTPTTIGLLNRHAAGPRMNIKSFTFSALLVLSSCAPLVENAPFPANPATLQAGDLLGPYDGTVIDAQTERPIAGVVVEGVWTFERGRGLHGPFYSKTQSVETTDDGRYYLPKINQLPDGQSTRLVRFTLTAYRRGYVAYRSDFKFPNGDVRNDFSQRLNKARLMKWEQGLSHHRHRMFIGGGEAIRKAAAWLGQPASLELEGKAVTLSATEEKKSLSLPVDRTLLDASPLLSEEEVRSVTGFGGSFQVGRLTDRVRSESYDSRHFKAAADSEAYDVAFRLWKNSAAEAEAQFEKLLATLPAAKLGEEIGDRSIRAQGGDVFGLAFILKEKGMVVQVSCGRLQCTDRAMVLQLAKLIEGHMNQLVSKGAPSEEGTSP